MMHRSFKMMVIPLLSLISFTACSYLPTASTSPIQQLEQVQNIEALPNTKTNLATLSRSNSGCLYGNMVFQKESIKESIFWNIPIRCKSKSSCGHIKTSDWF